jgi:hypothetical protein
MIVLLAVSVIGCYFLHLKIIDWWKRKPKLAKLLLVLWIIFSFLPILQEDEEDAGINGILFFQSISLNFPLFFLVLTNSFMKTYLNEVKSAKNPFNLFLERSSNN